jgi:hypothetical protein
VGVAEKLGQGRKIPTKVRKNPERVGKIFMKKLEKATKKQKT